MTEHTRSASAETLDQNYWNERWEQRETGWDIGYSSPPIEDYMVQFENKNAKILIPGCGNAHEAEFLLENGFTDITILDIAPNAVAILKKKFENNPEIKVVCDDFFYHHDRYHLIIEQTFFCALNPERRTEYVKKTAELLSPKGKIMGVLFDRFFERQGPPFGGTIEEYRGLFGKEFEIKTMEKCRNSIPARMGSEAFIILEKKEI